jgi:hypothetical protein
MSASQTPSRRFSVRAQHDEGRHMRLVEEACIEAAAIAYAEDQAPADSADLAVIVRDLEDGREHCFRIDRDTGQAAPCA